jgi:hypothetical protein
MLMHIEREQSQSLGTHAKVNKQITQESARECALRSTKYNDISICLVANLRDCIQTQNLAFCQPVCTRAGCSGQECV